MNTLYLRLFSVGYLLLSTLLFLGNWFQIKYSFIFVVGHIIFFALYARQFKSSEEKYIPYKSLVGIGILAIVWTFLMGVGGVFLQSTDYVAHNSKLFELYTQHWPILIDERQTFSCYYYGYYIVPALLFKLTGGISDSIIVFYTWVGVWLGLLWLNLVVSRNTFVFFSAILVGGGMFSLGIFSLAVFRFSLSDVPLFPLFVNSLFVVNQIASTLIPLGMLLFYKGDYKMSFYPITLSFLWSVFPALLLIIFSGIAWCLDLITKENKTSIKEILRDYLVPSILFLPTFIYLTSSDQLPVHGFYDFWSISAAIPFIDFLILSTIAFWLIRFKKDVKFAIPASYIFIALLLLGALGTYRLGLYNDLYMRASMPMLLIILIGIFQRLAFNIKTDYSAYINERSASNHFLSFFKYMGKYTPVLIWLVLGSLPSFFQLKVLLASNTLLKTSQPMPYDTFKNSYQALKAHYGEEGASQYLGNPKSFYYKHLAPVKSE